MASKGDKYSRYFLNYMKERSILMKPSDRVFVKTFKRESIEDVKDFLTSQELPIQFKESANFDHLLNIVDSYSPHLMIVASDEVFAMVLNIFTIAVEELNE